MYALFHLPITCFTNTTGRSFIIEILQVLFLSGLTLIIGPQKTFYFFARKQKIRGTICFLGGILLVFFKWPFTGILVETFGFLNLFGCVSLLKCSLMSPESEWIKQRLLPSDRHILATTTVHRNRIVATIYPRCESVLSEEFIFSVLIINPIIGSRPSSRLSNICSMTLRIHCPGQMRKNS